LFDLVARPKRVSRLLFSRYADGETYGDHTDDALMGDPPLRTDLAFTLFLAEPDTYEGGALVTTTALGEQVVKLAAGDAVLYGADTIHRVEPVTSGERWAAVGWVQSLVRDPRQRETLFDLTTARTRLAGAGAAREDLMLLDKVRGALLRMWADA
jgi:PKHD-type hydroxylase